MRPISTSTFCAVALALGMAVTTLAGAATAAESGGSPGAGQTGANPDSIRVHRNVEGSIGQVTSENAPPVHAQSGEVTAAQTLPKPLAVRAAPIWLYGNFGCVDAWASAYDYPRFNLGVIWPYRAFPDDGFTPEYAPATPELGVPPMEMQIRRLKSYKRPALNWETVKSQTIMDSWEHSGRWTTCGVYKKLVPGGIYQTRLRTLNGGPGPWVTTNQPETYYERPDAVRWKNVKLKDVPGGLRIRWKPPKSAEDTGGAKITKYRFRLKARVPVNTPKPTLTCKEHRNECTILNMIPGRRTYYIWIMHYNGHRWSPANKFRVCAGKC